jgi:hypothetical protein
MPMAAWCGLIVAAGLAGGCGPKPAPAAAAKPAAAKAGKAGAATNAPDGVSDQYTSVFEDLTPPRGRDPFYPNSHRRDVHVDVPEPVNARVDPVLVLKAVIRTSKRSQAVINSVIFEAGETQSVRVPSGKVRVKCLRIGKNFAEVQVEGETEPKTLMMEQKKY